MAYATITPIKAKRNEFTTAADYSGLLTAVASDGETTPTYGAVVAHTGRESRMLIIAENSHASAAKTVTIKAGNGIQGVNDLTLSLAAGKYSIISLESGAFKNVSGTNKGKVVITGESTDIKVAVLCAP